MKLFIVPYVASVDGGPAVSLFSADYDAGFFPLVFLLLS